MWVHVSLIVYLEVHQAIDRFKHQNSITRIRTFKANRPSIKMSMRLNSVASLIPSISKEQSENKNNSRLDEIGEALSTVEK